MFQFELLTTDPRTRARRGRLQTPHGTIETPIFMPVGTHGALKALTPAQVEETGAQIIMHFRSDAGALMFNSLLLFDDEGLLAKKLVFAFEFPLEVGSDSPIDDATYTPHHERDKPPGHPEWGLNCDRDGNSLLTPDMIVI